MSYFKKLMSLKLSQAFSFFFKEQRLYTPVFSNHAKQLQDANMKGQKQCTKIKDRYYEIAL